MQQKHTLLIHNVPCSQKSLLRFKEEVFYGTIQVSARYVAGYLLQKKEYPHG